MKILRQPIHSNRIISLGIIPIFLIIQLPTRVSPINRPSFPSKDSIQPFPFWNRKQTVVSLENNLDNRSNLRYQTFQNEEKSRLKKKTQKSLHRTLQQCHRQRQYRQAGSVTPVHIARTEPIVVICTPDTRTSTARRSRSTATYVTNRSIAPITWRSISWGCIGSTDTSYPGYVDRRDRQRPSPFNKSPEQGAAQARVRTVNSSSSSSRHSSSHSSNRSHSSSRSTRLIQGLITTRVTNCSRVLPLTRLQSRRFTKERRCLHQVSCNRIPRVAALQGGGCRTGAATAKAILREARKEPRSGGERILCNCETVKLEV